MEVGIVRLIILSAFNGQLKSEILEWPDWPLDIRFPFMGKDLDTNITYRIGTFRSTNRYIEDCHRLVQIYELCAIT